METNFVTRQTLQYHWNNFLKQRIDTILTFTLDKRKIINFFFNDNRVNMMIKCLTQNLRRLWKTDNLQDRLLTFSSIQSHISGWIGHSYDIVLAWSWCSAAGTSIHSWAFWLHLWLSLSGSWCPCLLFHHVWLCCLGTWIPPSLEDPLCSLWSARGLGHSES